MDLFSRLIGLYILLDILRQITGMVFRALRERVKARIPASRFYNTDR